MQKGSRNTPSYVFHFISNYRMDKHLNVYHIMRIAILYGLASPFELLLQVCDYN